MNAEAGVIVIGIGNLCRSDDAVGIVVARLLREEIPDGVAIVEEDCDTVSLLDLWKNARSVIMIDAVQSGAPPGTLHRFDLCREHLSGTFLQYSTHTFSLAEAVELARSLHQLPQQLILYGIEGESCAVGTRLSATVEKAVALAATRVLDDLRALIQ